MKGIPRFISLSATWFHQAVVPRKPSVPAGLKPWLRRGGRILAVYLALKAVAWLVPVPTGSLYRPSSTLVFDRRGELLQASLSTDDKWRIRTPVGQISPHLRRAVLGFEDRWFFWHPGFNPFSIGRALIQNARAGRIVSGGSTITMQIARLMEPKGRTVGGKVWEVLRALQLELRYSKKQLLEIYFNIAPYGGNIEGAAAASWLYLGKEASQVSMGEAALLTALPNSPSARPDINPARARKARDRVLRRLQKNGTISEQAYREAVLEELPAGRVKLPRVAPHFCRDLKSAYSGRSRLYSTLDARIQSTAEDLLSLHLGSLRTAGITNGAIVVIDNRSHDVLALVGSGNFYDPLTSGQVNGARAGRSPGSALKPFIYAQALQTGLISPASYLEDVPTDFSGYAPENYDRTFSGIVSARAALERSLNLPAVALEHSLADDGLYELLRRAEVDSLRRKSDYGLSIAIGGCEISLYDLTALYSALACSGEYVRPRQLKGDLLAEGITLFDPGTAYIITDILTGLQRPDLPACWEFTSLPRVAWKTGTSYGNRDAWSIGFNPRYTIGVWLGNFSGESARTLVGAEVATPILFELMNSVCRGQQIPWFKRPHTVDVREVCSLSGQLPGPDCPTLTEELYLPDRSPETECQFHQAVEVDDATGCRLPPRYPGRRPSHTRIYVEWPARVGTWMEKNGYTIQKLPPLLPGWQGCTPGSPPIIRSPSLDCRYRLREGVDPRFQKICFEASAGTDVQRLYWFVDGRLLGSARPGEKLFYVPVTGQHRVVCQDDMGRSTELTLVVEEAQ